MTRTHSLSWGGACVVLMVGVVVGGGPAWGGTVDRTVDMTMSEHGFWWDDFDSSYRTYDRWTFETSDVSFALDGEDLLEVKIRTPAGQRLVISEACTMSVDVSLYHDHWDDDFTWPFPFDGEMTLTGTNCPAIDFVDPLCETNGGVHRQMQWYGLTVESVAVWDLTEIRLTMDVSGVSDPLKVYRMSGDPLVWNQITFSRLTSATTDPGVFSAMVPEPTTLALLTLAGLLAGSRRRR